MRRFRRWLANDTIEVQTLYGPLIQQALGGWVGKRLFVALDTSMLWDMYGIVRLSVLYRGRAVPVAWCVLEQGAIGVIRSHSLKIAFNIKRLSVSRRDENRF